MNSYSVRDLRMTPKSIWDDLSSDGEVIITNNGKPKAILLNIPEGDFAHTLKTVRQAKAMSAFTSMKAKAADSGFMNDAEIEAEIDAVRKGKRCES